MSKLELLIGTIASGKSTYSRQRSKQGAIIINDDALVTALHGGYYNLYNKDLKPLYKSVEQSIMIHCILSGVDVVIDRPNLTKASRAKYLAIAKAMDIEVAQVIFPFQEPKVHALRRMGDNTRGYSFEHWLNVAKDHIGRYEPPEVDEGHDYIMQIEVRPPKHDK